MGLETNEDTEKKVEKNADGDSRNEFTSEANQSWTKNESNSARVYDENHIQDALKASKDLNLPIISLVTKDGNIDASTKASLNAHSKDAVFLSINNKNAQQMMNRGMESNDFWALANLAGAKGDVNNIKAGFVGKFDALNSEKVQGQGLQAKESAASIAELFASKTAVERSSDTELKQANLETPVKSDKSAEPAEKYNEKNVLQAINAAKESGKEILAVSVGKNGLSPEAQAQIDAASKDYKLILINKDNADQMMRKGLGNEEFWALANLMGAKGDLNNIKDNYMAVFSPKDFDKANPKFGFKAKSETYDAKAGLPNLQISNAQDSNAKAADKPPLDIFGKVKPIAEDDKFSFYQSEKKEKPEAVFPKVKPEAEPDKFNFNQGPSDTAKSRSLDSKKESEKQEAAKPGIKPEEKKEAGPSDEKKDSGNGSDAKKDSVEKKPDAAEVPKKVEPTKLKEAQFSTDDAVKAFELARQHNLPVIVYKGADFCGNCPPVKSAVESLASKIAGAPTTDAIVLKLNWERQMKIQDNPELSKLVNQLMPLNRSSFPEVRVYNPNDLSKPLKDGNGYGGEQAYLQSLVKLGKEAMQDNTKEKKAPEPRPDGGKPEPPKPEQAKPQEKRIELERKSAAKNDPSWLESQEIKPAVEQGKEKPAEKQKLKLEEIRFADAELSKAVELAKKNNLPLVVYTGANSCHWCPAASEKFASISNKMANAAETKAIVVKLTAETANALAGSNDANAALLQKVMSHGQYVPRVAVYNPNEMDKPLGNTTIAQWAESTLSSHIESSMKAAISKAAVSNSTEKSAKAYSEENMANAAEFARQNNKPMITFVSEKANPNIQKAFEYLNENKLAAAANISQNLANQKFSRGLEPRQFQALKSSLGSKSKDSSYVNANSAASIKADMTFNPEKQAVPKSPQEMLNFLKEAGVDLSDKKHEKAVMALLEGKAIPADTPPNSYKVNSPEEAAKVMAEAREKKLALVVHTKTTICDDNKCRLEKLDPEVPEKFADSAIFLELPRGGLVLSEDASAELKQINDLFKVSEDAHKTQIDMHVFSFGQDQNAELQQLDRHVDAIKNHYDYLRSLLKK
ncbi:MAG: thioredoxin family protein [Candidatus Obscuribacterales bacterium]|nr:thioredoxin family protein [Candidatus Obscuribacterales bacterium]